MNKRNILRLIILVIIISFAAILILHFIPKGKNRLIVELSSIVLMENDVYTVKAITYPKEEKIEYISENQDILNIDENGDIEAIKEGTTKIIVKSGSDEKIIDVNVNNNANIATGINIKENTVNLNVSDNYLLELKTYPEDSLTPFIIIESSNEDIISVQNGYLKALKEGNSQITVTALIDDKETSDAINVNVGASKEIKVTDLTFNEEIITMELNETYKLNPTISPYNATNTNIKYVIENENIIEILDDVIKAKAKGETKVTAISESGKTYDFTVNVTSSQGLLLNIQEISIAKGETYKLKSNFISGLDWYSNNNKVAIVDNNGIIKGNSEGIATITVVNNYGRINTVKVNVEGTGILVDNISFTESELSILPGGTYQLNTSISPSNAINNIITYETSDSRVATVTDDGIVTGRIEGSCYIIAYSSNNKMAQIKVDVKKIASCLIV